MHLENILDYAKSLIRSCTETGDYVIDATVGNGYDTLFLALLVGKTGHVFGFDIQKQAIENTKKRLAEHGIDHVTLYHTGHENILKSIPQSFKSCISGAIFNLGYLPHGNKEVTTHANTTISAISQILELIKIHGLIVVAVYPGHKEGKDESMALLQQLQELPQQRARVLKYQYINQSPDAPYIIAIEKCS